MVVSFDPCARERVTRAGGDTPKASRQDFQRPVLFPPFFGPCCGYGDCGCTTSWKDKRSLRESLHDLKDLLIRLNEYCNYFDMRFEKYSLRLLLKNRISTSQLLERAGLNNLHLSTMISIFFSRQIVGYIYIISKTLGEKRDSLILFVPSVHKLGTGGGHRACVLPFVAKSGGLTVA